MTRFKQGPRIAPGGRLLGVRLVIRGHDLPGGSYTGHARIAVGLQVRTEPSDVVPGDSGSARWETDVRVVDGECAVRLSTAARATAWST
jgi:hypothetical protein